MGKVKLQPCCSPNINIKLIIALDKQINALYTWKYIQYIEFHVQIQMEEQVKIGAGYELCCVKCPSETSFQLN